MFNKIQHASLSELPTAGKHTGTSARRLPVWLRRTAPVAPDIEIWQAQLDPGPEAVSQCSALLSPDERLRASRFHFERDRRRFIVARATLRILVGKSLDVAPADIAFGYTESGKPFVEKPAEGIHFNISHSEDCALYALSAVRALGVDIECVERKIDHHSIARRFFTRNEWSTLQQLPDSIMKRVFFSVWTRKEAIAKAMGSGLALPFDQFEVTTDADARPRILQLAPEMGDIADWSLHLVESDPHYVAAVAAYRQL